MNNAQLVGRFTKDPELRYSQSGTAITNFTLAVRNPFKSDGEADFIQCVAWGVGAELIAEKHEKGNMIGVSGRIQTRSYENDEGRMVYITEVNVNEIHLIQTRDYASNGNQQNNSSSNPNSRNKPNKNQNKSNNRNSGNGNRNNRQNP